MIKTYLLTNNSVDWDETEQMIINAESAKKARVIANEFCHDEGKIWTNPKRTTCKRIYHNKTEILLQSVRWG